MSTVPGERLENSDDNCARCAYRSSVSYDHRRVAATYDTLNGSRDDAGFYVDLAAEIEASDVVDVGCGTGAVTVALATPGRRVTGVDPAEAMLDVARARPGGERVRWILGDAAAVDVSAADLAIMTGHAAQEIIDDAEWDAALTSLHRALRPDGLLAFDARDPRVRDWERWNPQDFRQRVECPGEGVVETWHRVLEVAHGRVRMESGFRFVDSGDELTIPGQLRFRTEAELTSSLVRAGFDVEAVFGGGDRRPAPDPSGELIFLARRR